jgi:molybdopterin molybdotransferase
MIDVAAAKELVKKHTCLLSPVLRSVQDATGLVLAADIYARYDIPPFNQSSMDGYAFAYKDWELKNNLTIQGEVAAGSTSNLSISPKQAVRIFTGAAVPAGADTVVMQEKTEIKDNELIIGDQQLKRGTNVRPKGSEIKAGDLALSKENILSPAAVGFLSGMGITEVTVYRKPSIQIIVTGKELQEPGKQLAYGQVYESNSFALRAVLQQFHLNEIRIEWVDDNPGLIEKSLHNALQNADLVLLTGGISVGDYDYVLQAANACGVEKIFHRVKQRPGKPLFFGKKDERLVFGLPGNPSSVLTCFYEYVLPSIENMMGFKKSSIGREMSALTHDYVKSAGLTHFLKGNYAQGRVTPLEAQESYRMSSFARANCLIYLEEDKEEWKSGDSVEVHLLPFINGQYAG